MCRSYSGKYGPRDHWKAGCDQIGDSRAVRRGTYFAGGYAGYRQNNVSKVISKIDRCGVWADSIYAGSSPARSDRAECVSSKGGTVCIWTGLL